MDTQNDLNDAIEIRKHVRESYAKRAVEFDPHKTSSCCSPNSCINVDQISTIYQIPDAADLPIEISGLSLGCGDPITLASLQSGQVVLDLGSGGGIDCFLAAKRVGDEGKVIGVDMTPEMLEKARANRIRMGVKNVEFRLGEIEHLPVEDNSVDVIISNCVINLSTDKPQVFREAFRVLRTKGKLAISDVVTNGPLSQEIKNDLSAWAGCIAGALDVNDYIEVIQSAGFKDIQVTPVYMDPSLIDEAIKQLDIPVQKDRASEDIYNTVFNAQISAVKP